MTDDSFRSDELPTEVLDAIVIGGGAAGLSGALMLGRSRRSVLVVDGGEPRNAPADGIHGLLGHEGTPPADYVSRGRDEVRRYGVRVARGNVVGARPAAPGSDGDLRFEVDLATGESLAARRLLVATGARDELPDLPGLAAHWGHGVVHCPYCHGWEVRDRPIGILGRGPLSVHQVLMFRQLSDDVVYFAQGTELDDAAREQFAARSIEVHDAPLREVETGEDGEIAGVLLADGTRVARSVLAVATTVSPRLDGLDGLGLEIEQLPAWMGSKVETGMAGVTSVPGVWAAGNIADPMAQVGASAAAGALAGAHVNASLATADTEAAVLRARAGAAGG